MHGAAVRQIQLEACRRSKCNQHLFKSICIKKMFAVLYSITTGFTIKINPCF